MTGSQIHLIEAYNAQIEELGGKPVKYTASSDPFIVLAAIVPVLTSLIASGGGGGGTTLHNLLTQASRGLSDQHPMSAITGLVAALAAKAAEADLTAHESATDAHSGLFSDKADKAKLQSVVTDYSVSASGTAITVTISLYDALTDSSTTAQRTFPLASASQPGAMPKESFAALTQAIQDIASLKAQGGRWITQNFATKAALDAYTIQDTVNIGDWTDVIADESHSGQHSRYSVINSGTDETPVKAWAYQYEVQEVSIGNFTQGGSGLIKGSADGTDNAGKIFAESDGTASVIGWDALTDRVTALETFQNRDEGFATKAQGEAADSAVQPNADATQNHLAAFDDSGKPVNDSGVWADVTTKSGHSTDLEIASGTNEASSIKMETFTTDESADDAKIYMRVQRNSATKNNGQLDIQGPASSGGAASKKSTLVLPEGTTDLSTMAQTFITPSTINYENMVAALPIEGKTYISNDNPTAGQINIARRTSTEVTIVSVSRTTPYIYHRYITSTVDTGFIQIGIADNAIDGTPSASNKILTQGSVLSNAALSTDPATSNDIAGLTSKAIHSLLVGADGISKTVINVTASMIAAAQAALSEATKNGWFYIMAWLSANYGCGFYRVSSAVLPDTIVDLPASSNAPSANYYSWVYNGNGNLEDMGVIAIYQQHPTVGNTETAFIFGCNSSGAGGWYCNVPVSQVATL